MGGEDRGESGFVAGADGRAPLIPCWWLSLEQRVLLGEAKNLSLFAYSIVRLRVAEGK